MGKDRKLVFMKIFRTCLDELELDNQSDFEVLHLRWIEEREETIIKLREICQDFGDNDWPDDLYLPDIIEKHLYNHLQ